ncbi:MAG: fumarylacetoacetate hydrolase family protein, partial [Betaproteobacteria bacterium]
MKLLRHGPKGREKPAVLDAEGRARDLSGLIGDITPSTLAPENLCALAGVDLRARPVVQPGALAVPWSGMGKFVAIGLNYADHAAESNMPTPKEPIVFMKTTSCAVGCNHPIVLPQGSVKTDWEVELGVVIGKRARYVTEADALSHVAGYCVINDVSEREYQLERGGQWDKG